MLPVVVDELRDARTPHGAAAAAERDVVGPIAVPGADAVANVRVSSVDELVGYPGHAEPVRVRVVAAALIDRLEAVERPLHVDVVSVTSHRLRQSALQRVAHVAPEVQ